MWAADGRQRAEWERFGHVLAAISGLNGGPADPQKFIPKRYRAPEPPEPVKTQEQIDRESEIAWKVLGHWITGGRGDPADVFSEEGGAE